MTVLALLMLLVAVAAFALSQARHWATVLRRPMPTVWPRVARATGGTLLVAALATFVDAEGAGFGALLWVFGSCASAAAVAFALAAVRPPLR